MRHARAVPRCLLMQLLCKPAVRGSPAVCCATAPCSMQMLTRPTNATPAGPRLLWSVKAARGALRSVVAIPGASGPAGGAGMLLGRGGSGALLATAGADGAVRVWRGTDGRLLQSVESAHYRWARQQGRPL